LEDTPRARQWLHREWLDVVRRDAKSLPNNNDFIEWPPAG
jgi:hypothetical protein